MATDWIGRARQASPSRGGTAGWKAGLAGAVVVVTLAIGGAAPSPVLSTALPVASQNGPIIIDGPWTSVPSGAGPGVTLDTEWGALTLQSDMTSLAFLLQPDSDKTAFPNSVWGLSSLDRRLYLTYGDYWSNRGPVDIVSYDPLENAPRREMLDAPEEIMWGWHGAADGTLYAGGGDARESWTFGNFYVNDGAGWQKRRTIYNGLHVYSVVDFLGRLYAAYGNDGTSPVSYAFVLTSTNHGASWSYERIGPESVQNSQVGAFATVSHEKRSYLYALLYVMPTGAQTGAYRLYRSDGHTWKQVRISDRLGEFNPLQMIAFGDVMLVRGFVFNPQTGYASATYVLDGQRQTEVASLRNKNVLLSYCKVHAGKLYCILDERPLDRNVEVPAYSLYRAQDAQVWERVGAITLSPGAEPRSIGFAHGRLYLGATNAGWWDDVPGVFELWPKFVYPIKYANLCWVAEVPSGANLALKIRTSAAYTDIFNQPWVGPDGTGNSAFTTSGQGLHSQHNGHTVFQVAVHKTANSAGQLPVLWYLTLETGNGPITLAVDQGPGLYTAVNSTDPAGAEYRSPVFRLLEPIASASLFFEGAAPGATRLRLQVRSASSEALLGQQPFAGPGGTAATFYETNGQSLRAGHNGDTYIQYRAVLSSSERTRAPFLRKVTLMTRSDRLDHLSLQLNYSAVWKAGAPKSVKVSARLADDRVIPVQGSVALSARDMSGKPVPIEPAEVTLVGGLGEVDATLQRSTATQICASLAGRTSCSAVIPVRPGPPAAFLVTTTLPEPIPNWAPVGQAGRPFGLALRVTDQYRNTVTDYMGTVRCESRQWSVVPSQLPAAYAFNLADQGYREFPGGAMISTPGEWNLVCFDQRDPQIAGTQTVNLWAAPAR